MHTIKKWHIVDREFTVDNGALTPTLKIKRKVIANLYEGEINDLYKRQDAKL